MTHRRKRNLILGLAALILVLGVAYLLTWSPAYAPAGGRAIEVNGAELGVALAPPLVFYADTPEALIALPGPTGSDWRVLRVDLKDGQQEPTSVDPFDQAHYRPVDIAGQDYRVDGRYERLSAPAGTGVAEQRFSGIHMRLPRYRFFGFPEADQRGWVWMESYTGGSRIEVLPADGQEPLAVLSRRLFNARYVDGLADLGAWTPDGRFFVVASLEGGQATLYFIDTDKE